MGNEKKVIDVLKDSTDIIVSRKSLDNKHGDDSPDEERDAFRLDTNDIDDVIRSLFKHWSRDISTFLTDFLKRRFITIWLYLCIVCYYRIRVHSLIYEPISIFFCLVAVKRNKDGTQDYKDSGNWNSVVVFIKS